jgi:hypothetical protein
LTSELHIPQQLATYQSTVTHSGAPEEALYTLAIGVPNPFAQQHT